MSNVIVPSSPADQKEIYQAIKEISNSKLRIESENDYIKDTVNDIVEKHDLPKKLVNKIANAYHKQQASEVMAEAEDFEILYDTLFGVTDGEQNAA